jgi:hypothetical protein
MLRRWPAAAALSALVVALFVVACLSPTLPLPPPEAPTVTMVDSEHVQLSAGCYGAQPSANIIVLNTTASAEVMSGEIDAGYESGVIATPCGSWSMVVFARPTDQLSITQTVGQSVSQPLFICLGSPADECSPQ